MAYERYVLEMTSPGGSYSLNIDSSPNLWEIREEKEKVKKAHPDREVRIVKITEEVIE